MCTQTGPKAPWRCKKNQLLMALCEATQITHFISQIRSVTEHLEPFQKENGELCRPVSITQEESGSAYRLEVGLRVTSPFGNGCKRQVEKNHLSGAFGPVPKMTSHNASHDLAGFWIRPFLITQTCSSVVLTVSEAAAC